jgi:hypothetical protein
MTREEVIDIIKEVLTASREEFILAAAERTLLMIPDTIGNLLASHAALHKINTKFYSEHPEFKDKRDVVQSVVEMIEGHNPLMDYEEILKEAAPEIKRRLIAVQDLNMRNVTPQIQRDFSRVNMSGVVGPNGEI